MQGSYRAIDEISMRRLADLGYDAVHPSFAVRLFDDTSMRAPHSIFDEISHGSPMTGSPMRRISDAMSYI